MSGTRQWSSGDPTVWVTLGSSFIHCSPQESLEADIIISIFQIKWGSRNSHKLKIWGSVETAKTIDIEPDSNFTVSAACTFYRWNFPEEPMTGRGAESERGDQPSGKLSSWFRQTQPTNSYEVCWAPFSELIFSQKNQRLYWRIPFHNSKRVSWLLYLSFGLKLTKHALPFPSLPTSPVTEEEAGLGLHCRPAMEHELGWNSWY